jgi:polysaccharide export outer membrane protein
VQSENASEGPYLIGPSDVLSIFVYKEPALSGKVKVQPDGRISIPLVQDISAAGSTLAQLKAEIENRLKDKIQEPNVTVILESTSSYRVYVIGKVQRAGPLTSETPLTVLEALALAGGFEEFARKDEIRIVRTIAVTNGQQTNFSFKYSDVIGGDPKLQNMVLKSGDVVVVP